MNYLYHPNIAKIYKIFKKTKQITKYFKRNNNIFTLSQYISLFLLLSS